MNTFEKVSDVTKAMVFMSILCLSAHGSTPREQLSGIDHSHAHKEMKGSLLNALVFVSTQFRVPVIGELVGPQDHDLVIPAGTDSARQILDQLVSQSRGYEWSVHLGVVHFYERRVVNAKGNFLNLRLRTFEIPPNVSDLKLILRERLTNDAKGLTGAVISYMASPELKEEVIASKRLQNATGRKILVTSAELTPKFTSIIVFPRREPKGNEDVDYASRNWFWLPVGKGGIGTIQVR